MSHTRSGAVADEPLAASRGEPSTLDDGPLTATQRDLLVKIHRIKSEPIVTTHGGTTRSDEDVATSRNINKRINPGYVDMPYRSSNSVNYAYVPPVSFSRAFLKKESDCGFQKYAAAAILSGVNLKKTGH